MTPEEVLQALDIKGDSGKTLCPAHEDDKPSLSVTLTERDADGEPIILVRCHAGCEQSEVLRALEEVEGITLSDLGGSTRRAPKEMARYVYRDAAGEPVFTKVRYEPKAFFIEPAGAGEKGLLYHLPEILASPASTPLLWVEGEKGADALKAHGFLSTTVGGASKTVNGAAKWLRERRVVIIPDNDGPGRNHAAETQRALNGQAQVVRILELPGLPVKGDVVDWFEQGHTAEELKKLVARSLGVTSAKSIVPSTPEWAWRPRIPATGLTIIFGDAGIGKTTMMLDLIARWTNGDPMPESVKTHSTPINVGVYGFEDDPKSVIVPRLMAAGANLDRVMFLEMDRNKCILPDQVGRMREICKEFDIKVLVLDNIENGMGGFIDSNNSRSLRAALNPLSSFGIPVVAIHHPKKGSVFVDPTEAMSGSQAYTNVARSTMIVVPTSDDLTQEIAFAAVKSNYAAVKDTRTLYFRVVSKNVEGLSEPQPHILWVGGDYVPAREWTAKARERLTKAREERATASVNPKPDSQPEAPPIDFKEFAEKLVQEKKIDPWVKEQQEKVKRSEEARAVRSYEE